MTGPHANNRFARPRRRRLAAHAVFICLAAGSAAADWPQMLGPTRDGRSPETDLNWAWGPTGPTIGWTKAVGRGFAGVAVVGETVYLAHRVENQEIVTALDAGTGKERWAAASPTKYRDDFGFDDGPRCVPVVADGRVFALGPNGDLHALDAGTGKKLWHRNLLADYGAPKGYFGVGAGPVAVARRLLVNVGAKKAGVVAFDPATGKELGRATDDPAGYSSPAVAGVRGRELAVFFTRTGLVALDPTTMAVAHTKVWRSRLDASVNAATPLVWDSHIFLTASYGTGAVLLRPTAGVEEPEEVWASDKALSSQYTTPVRVGDFLFGTDGRADGPAARLRCVEWGSGAVRWSKDAFGCAHVIAADGGLLALTQDGELVRFDADPTRYAERRRAKVLNAPSRAAPALSGGRLFVRDETTLVALDLRK